ncbi:MAG: hypothetical protein GY719_11185, partial [bacterium]|nr:hypothetical protein [bacterium]
MLTKTSNLRALTLALVAAGALAVTPPAGADVPGSPHGDLAIECSDCHTVEGWTPLREPPRFDHATTRFPLSGAHNVTTCADCHTSLVFDQAPDSCATCHAGDLEGVREPDHEGLPTTCESCHSPSGWSPATFDHDQTLFSLEGMHRTADCASCHTDGYAGTPSDCFTCHGGDFNSAAEPDHDGLSTTCEDCHSVNGWSPANFDHNQTAFSLQGAHRVVDCQSCHADGFAGTPTDCFSCHESDYSAAAEPSHEGFPTTCEDCHQLSGWSPATFDHNQTAFSLQGAHVSVDCQSCHASGYAGTPQDCFSCHESDYDGAAEPDHDGFPTTCEDCHQLSGWSPANFDHNQTAFALQGAHRAVDCQSCHASGYAGTPQDCFSCHESDYDGAAEPDHDG